MKYLLIIAAFMLGSVLADAQTNGGVTGSGQNSGTSGTTGNSVNNKNKKATTGKGTKNTNNINKNTGDNGNNNSKGSQSRKESNAGGQVRGEEAELITAQPALEQADVETRVDAGTEKTKANEVEATKAPANSTQAYIPGTPVGTGGAGGDNMAGSRAGSAIQTQDQVAKADSVYDNENKVRPMNKKTGQGTKGNNNGVKGRGNHGKAVGNKHRQ